MHKKCAANVTPNVTLCLTEEGITNQHHVDIRNFSCVPAATTTSIQITSSLHRFFPTMIAVWPKQQLPQPSTSVCSPFVTPVGFRGSERMSICF